MRTFGPSVGKPVVALAVLLVVVAWHGPVADARGASEASHLGKHETPAPPTITSEPQPLAALPGASVILTVMAEGTPPFYYQWRLNGTDLTGATNDVLVLPHVGHADWGNYSVVVSNPYGSATSAGAKLAGRPAQAGDVDVSFNPGASINANIHCLAVQPDGKVLIGGEFSAAAGAVRGRIARLNPDGSTDYTFLNGLAGADSIICSVALQPDGKVLIGGEFSSVNGQPRQSIARLNPDGSLDTAFLKGLPGTDHFTVYSVALQPDGKVLIGGSFSEVNGQARESLARLNPDGSLDTSFLNGLAGPNSGVISLALQPDGKVLIGGWFTKVNGQARNRIARLNPDGSLDTAFLKSLAGANDVVETIALQADGKVLIGGDFGSVNSVSRNKIARLNPDGSLDTAFVVRLELFDTVFSIAVQPDGKVLIGGDFSDVNGQARHRLARLNADGSLDTAFLNGLAAADNWVGAVALGPDGKVLIGGEFSKVNGQGRNRIARLNPDGSLDTSFLNGVDGADNRIDSVALQPDGKVLIGGEFEWVKGQARRGLARLNPDGSLDTAFLNGLPGPDFSAYSVALQPDGKVLIGGDFYSVNGQERHGIARLNSDGSLDTAFLNGLYGVEFMVYSVAPQTDGKVLIGGPFSTVNGQARQGIARLNPDGSLDTGFVGALTGVYSEVRSLALQPDGKVLIGGSFTNVNGLARKSLARLNPDGSLDTAFADALAGSSSEVKSLALQPDGKVLIGGGFTKVNGQARNSVARLNPDGSLDTGFVDGLAGVSRLVWSLALQPDGKVLVGGWSVSVKGQARNCLARLNSDGSLDTAFLKGLDGPNEEVRSLALQPDGKVLIGGWFGGVNGVPASGVARLWGQGWPTLELVGRPTGFRLQWTGQAGRSYRVQSSSDLVQWSDLATVTAAQERVVYDLPATGPPVLFLRVLAP